MSFYVNVGYTFALDTSIQPQGSIVPCISMPMHQLERRNLDDYGHMQNRLFDPQLYLAGMVAAQSPGHCAKLATYPWFGVEGLLEYVSGVQKQAAWTKEAREAVKALWPGQAPTEPEKIANGARTCVEFQIQNGAWGLILPSPLTVDPTADYSNELAWLDEGLKQVTKLGGPERPIFATVAISDLALKYSVNPKNNLLLDIILDQVSARDVHGVYIVIEQASERDDTRQCGNPRTLRSLLYLVHRFAHESNLRVGVNFVGAFGLACEAAGAEWWGSNWYKSLHRVRLADKVGAGRVFPSYWSMPATLDVNVASEFDALASADLSKFRDDTPASVGLLDAAAQGKKASSVPAWAYRPSNAKAPIQHFLQSAVKHEALHAAQPKGKPRLDFVEGWLQNADALTTWAISQLGTSAKTKLDHPSAWLEAFQNYREDHGV